jgi:6-phosphofructokinase 2
MTAIVTLGLNPAIDVSSDADVVRSMHKVRTFNETYDPGGGGINVARVVTELGGECEVVYLAGGITGALLGNLLDGLKVRRRLIPIAGNTRISFTVHEQETGLEYRFVAAGPTLGRAELDACLKAVEALDFRYFVASGSLPQGVAADYLAEIAAVVVKKGAKFVLDSSGPGLKTTLQKAPVFLVKPSLNELEHLVGNALDADGARDAASDLVRRGCAEMVAVTMGPDGAILATREHIFYARALKVVAKSTVGAGDSFLGAVVWALAAGRSIEDALAYGIAGGAAALLNPGTKLVARDNVLKFYEEARRGVSIVS